MKYSNMAFAVSVLVLASVASAADSAVANPKVAKEKVVATSTVGAKGTALEEDYIILSPFEVSDRDTRPGKVQNHKLTAAQEAALLDDDSSLSKD